MADAPPKARTVHLSTTAKEAARKSRAADNTLLTAGFVTPSLRPEWSPERRGRGEKGG